MSSTNVPVMVAMIIVGSAMTGHLVVLGRIPAAIVEFIIAQNLYPLLLIILLNIIMFIIGIRCCG